MGSPFSVDLGEQADGEDDEDDGEDDEDDGEDGEAGSEVTPPSALQR